MNHVLKRAFGLLICIFSLCAQDSAALLLSRIQAAKEQPLQNGKITDGALTELAHIDLELLQALLPPVDVSHLTSVGRALYADDASLECSYNHSRPCTTPLWSGLQKRFDGPENCFFPSGAPNLEILLKPSISSGSNIVVYRFLLGQLSYERILQFNPVTRQIVKIVAREQKK